MSMQTRDAYEEKLDQALEKLQKCQEHYHVSSCSHCKQYLACELRREYVKVVYESMSKGDTGGFEF